MIVLPCIQWVIAQKTYVTFIFLMTYIFGLLFKLVGRSSTR